MPEGNEVGAEAGASAPVVEKDAHIALLCQSIVVLTPGAQPNRKAPAAEQQGRRPEGGAGIAVDQWQLKGIVADQLVDIGLVAQKPQGIVGGDPAAAGVSAGAQAVAPLVSGDPGLVVDQFLHISSGDGRR